MDGLEASGHNKGLDIHVVSMEAPILTQNDGSRAGVRTRLTSIGK